MLGDIYALVVLAKGTAVTDGFGGEGVGGDEAAGFTDFAFGFGVCGYLSLVLVCVTGRMFLRGCVVTCYDRS